jgi:hypothetical protein
VVDSVPILDAMALDTGARRASGLFTARLLGAGVVAGGYVVPLAPDVGTVCPLRRLTGVPCPFCGMTTGVVSTVHGDLSAAIAANPAAPLLVLAVIAAWVLWAVGRRGPLVPRRLAGPAAVTAVGAVWVYQLLRVF